MKKPLFTTDLTCQDTKMPRILKFILKSFVSPIDNPKAQGDPKKMRYLENKATESLFGRMLFGKVIELWKVEDLLIPSENPDLKARVYTPNEKDHLPAIIFFHGGGYVIGSLTSYDKICRNIARDLDCIVISIDYRLAPEHKFPQAVNDSWTAVQWIFAQIRQLNLDSSRIFVMGDSAGGGLAMVMGKKSRDSPTISIAGQILLYPWIDGNLENYPSMQKFQKGFGLSKANMEFFRDSYKNSQSDLSNPDFSPILLEDFSNLPPTFVVTASHDPLRDQGYALAQKLHDAENLLIFKNYQSTIHGFISVFKSLPNGRKMYDDVIATIQTMLDSKKG